MASPPPVDLLHLLAGLTRTLDGHGIPFMLIGGQAVLVHGRPRFTEDIDATLGVGPDELDRVLAACRDLQLDPLPEEVRAFVEETFVLPTRHRSSRLRVDLVFSTLPYERQAIERAQRLEVGGAGVPFATAEDLLIHKLFAGRARDQEDAVDIVRRRGTGMDWDYVDRWIAEFALIPGRETLPAQVTRLRRDAEG